VEDPLLVGGLGPGALRVPPKHGPASDAAVESSTVRDPARLNDQLGASDASEVSFVVHDPDICVKYLVWFFWS